MKFIRVSSLVGDVGKNAKLAYETEEIAKREREHWSKASAEEALPPSEPALSEPSSEPEPEKDRDTLIQEHLKNNRDKYMSVFEDLFPTTQMVVTGLEYRGAMTKDKIRVVVDIQTPLINYDALKVLAAKEIGIEATGERTFKIYNIWLPKVKDATIQ